MCVTSETDEVVMPNNGIESPALDDANITGTAEGNARLKKGPWTSAEDAILVEYVTKHGEGNWNAVQRHTGLARCGKSCRLRWANHLRPDLKKGAFTPEEENLIIELHAQIGNKWARMASEMPGRTDNEIKNYWNTRIKRRQRAGLPIYPPDIGCHALNENQQNDSLTTFSSGDAHCQDAMPVNSFDIPAVEFKNLALNQHVKPPTFLDLPSSGFLDIPGSGFVPHALPYPYPNKSVLPTTMHPPKRFRVSESMFPGSNGTMSNIVSDGSQYQIGGYVQNAQPFTYSPPFDPNTTFNHPPPSTVLPDSHAIINCNPPSTLEPSWAMKQELPSLQIQEDNWGSASSPLPPLESADALIPTPPNEQHNPSCQFSMQDSDLLDVALHDSQTVKLTTNSSDLLSSHASIAGFNLIDGSSQLIHDHETAWELYGGLTSPFGHSPPTMFGEGNGETEAMTGFKFAEEAAIWFPTQYNSIKGETANEMFSQQLQDVFLASDCFDPEKQHNT